MARGWRLVSAVGDGGEVWTVSDFWTWVNKTSTCWLWMGGRNSKGYPYFYDGSRTRRAHRVAYELVCGVIPAGMTLDHLCRVRHCVNPAHLEPVSDRENILRGNGWSGRNARKTHCPQGHEYTPENTRIHTSGGRLCVTCDRARKRKVAV
jgi:HNH endonuclease